MLADEGLLSTVFHPTVEILQLLRKLDFAFQMNFHNRNSKYLVKTELEVSSLKKYPKQCVARTALDEPAQAALKTFSPKIAQHFCPCNYSFGLILIKYSVIIFHLHVLAFSQLKLIVLHLHILTLSRIRLIR